MVVIRAAAFRQRNKCLSVLYDGRNDQKYTQRDIDRAHQDVDNHTYRSRSTWSRF